MVQNNVSQKTGNRSWSWVAAFVVFTTAAVAVTLIYVQPDIKLTVKLREGMIEFYKVTDQIHKDINQIDKDKKKLEADKRVFEEEKRQFAENPKYVGTFGGNELMPAIVDQLKQAHDGSPREIILMVDMASYGAFTKHEFDNYWDAVTNLTVAQKNQENPVAAIFLTDPKAWEVLDTQFPAKEWKFTRRNLEKNFQAWFRKHDVVTSISSLPKPVISSDRLAHLATNDGVKSLRRIEFFESVLAYNNWLMKRAKQSGMNIGRSNTRFPMHMWLIDPGFDNETLISHYSLVDFATATDEPLFIAPPKTASSLKHISKGYRIALEKKQVAYDRLLKFSKLIMARASDEGRAWFRWTHANGKAEGFEPALLKAITKRIAHQWDLDPIDINEKKFAWPSLFNAPTQNEANLLISTISYREAREKKYGLIFSIPYHEASLAIVAPWDLLAGDSMASILKGNTVAVQRDATAFQLLNALDAELNVTPKPFTDISDSVDELSPQVPVLIADAPLAAVLAGRASDETGKKYGLYEIKSEELPKDLPPDARKEQYVIGVAANEKRLLRAINDAIQSLGRSGQLENMKIQAKELYSKHTGIPFYDLK